MATFIATLQYTQQGVPAIHESPQRAAAFRSVAKRMGIEIKDFYWTLGALDGVILFDAPNEEAATAAMLHLSSCGNVHTTTSRAFNSAEMEKVLELLAKL